MKSLMDGKRLLAGVLAAGLLFTAAALSPPDKGRVFPDIPAGFWAESCIRELKNSGQIGGYPDGNFRPDGTVSYGEFLKMALADLKPGAAAAGRHWATPYYEAGLAGCFTSADIPYSALDQPIPRRLMALVVSGRLGADKKVSDFGDYEKLSDQIRDISPKTPYEYEIVKAYAAGILNGYPDQTFRPDACLNRAEAAAVIKRLADKLGSGKSPAAPTGSAAGPAGGPTAGSEGTPAAGSGGAATAVPLVEEQTGAAAFYTKLDYLITVRDWGTQPAEREKQLRAILQKHLPEQVDAVLKALTRFADKPLPPGKQGLHKEYFGGRPLMFDRYNGNARIFIFPVGYQDEYWGIKPGEVYEEFF